MLPRLICSNCGFNEELVCDIEIIDTMCGECNEWNTLYVSQNLKTTEDRDGM